MTKSEYVVYGCIVLVVLSLVVNGFIYITGFHYETSRGEHVGYTTAVQRSGLIFKTGTAFVKTDNQSSQEDDYCFIDPQVEVQLKNFAETKERVKIGYFGWLAAGIKNCGDEGQVIYKVEPVLSNGNAQ